MADMLAGRVVAKALKAEGVNTVFLLCGGHVTPIYLGCEDEGIRLIDVRHEQSAAFAADGWARVTGQPGVALVTAGPGVTNTVTAVTNAHKAGSPLVLIGGRAPTSEVDRGSLQDMDQLKVMRPITKWARTVPAAERIPEYVAMAFRHALAGKPGPVYLELPIDLLLKLVDDEELDWPTNPGRDARPAGDPERVDQAAELLRTARRPVILGGSGLWWSRAADDLRALAEDAHLPVFLNAMGRGALPPEHPLLFAHARRQALAAADAVLLLGVPLDFRLGFGRGINADAALIQVDIDGAVLGHNRGADVGLVGDARLVIRQLHEALGARADRGWLAELGEHESARAADIATKCDRDDAPVNHYRLAREINDLVDEDTIVIGDGGDVVVVGGRIIRARRHGQWLDPGPFGVLGVGVPFALAAQLARPEKQVILLAGDGAFGLTGMDLETLVRHDLPVVVVIGNDHGWGQIRTPQLRFFGAERSTATDLSATTRYDLLAQSLGAHGERVASPAEIRPAIERALACGKPAVVEVLVDPRGLSDEANSREMAI